MTYVVGSNFFELTESSIDSHTSPNECGCYRICFLQGKAKKDGANSQNLNVVVLRQWAPNLRESLKEEMKKLQDKGITENDLKLYVFRILNP